MMSPDGPFGRLCTAIVTPFHGDGEVDLDTAAGLAEYLVDEQRNDALVVNGTTGESPTTTDAEKADLVRAVSNAVGDRAAVIAGIGTANTAHSIRLAQEAAKAGASGLLIVTPYYSKPTQAGLLAHFRAVADATELPVVVYDIPSRTGTPIATETMLAIAAHERIVAVKDSKGDLTASARVIAEAGLAYYCGEDAQTLPLLAVGGTGVIGTSTHFTGADTKAMIEAYVRGDVGEALRLHQRLLPIFTGIFRAPGTVMVKAGLAMRGRPAGPVRLPLVEATAEEIASLRADLTAAGL